MMIDKTTEDSVKAVSPVISRRSIKRRKTQRELTAEINRLQHALAKCLEHADSGIAGSEGYRLAQDKRLAQLANKIDELQLAIEQLQRHTAPLLRISDTLDHISNVISKKLKGK